MLTNMNLGGTEKAFLNLLDGISSEDYAVTCLLLERKGELLDEIPSWVKIEVIENYDILKPLIMLPPLQLAKDYLKKDISTAFGIAFWHLVFKITNDRTKYYEYILRKYAKAEIKPFDIAVAYTGPMDFVSIYILKCINATEKIQWIHFDVSKFSFNSKLAQRIYPKFSKICVVSEPARRQLLKLVSGIKDKTVVKHNIISEKKCMEMAKEGKGFEDKFDGIRILTVGRLSEEKGQDFVPDILFRLKKRGLKVRWYLIGCGSLENKLIESIIKLDLEEDLILLGKSLNPYPFYQQSDLYVQTSKHEGFCITIAEAKIFNLPIISTDTAGAKELCTGENEKIVERDIDKMYLKILEEIENLGIV